MYSLDFGWTAGGNETAWNVEYGTSGFTLGTGTLTTVSSNPTNISGLTGNTSYDLFVQADCGTSGVGPWAGPFTVTTLCDAFTAPYIETFDATTTIPSCWTETQTSGSGWVFSGNPGYDAGSNGRAAGTYAWIDFSGTDVGAVEQKDRLKVSYRRGDYRASLSALRIGELADSGEQSAGFMYLIPSMTTADLSISKKIELGGNKGRVKFVVKNIADERAPLADGYNGFFSDVHSDMGRNYYLNLRVDF